MEIIGRSGQFSELERKVLEAIAAAVIPEDHSFNVPGAHDPLILATILEKVEEQFAERVRSGIRLLTSEVDPLDLTPEELLGVIDGDSRFRSLYQVLTIAIMQAYYQDNRVLVSLGLEPRPPFPAGHEVETGDWALLDPVKARASFYRQT
jgi:hypothetical protein